MPVHEGKKDMKSLAAAVIVLAGAVLAASGVLADALARHRYNNYSPLGMGVGLVLGLIGLICLVGDWLGGGRSEA